MFMFIKINIDLNWNKKVETKQFMDKNKCNDMLIIFCVIIAQISQPYVETVVQKKYLVIFCCVIVICTKSNQTLSTLIYLLALEIMKKKCNLLILQ